MFKSQSLKFAFSVLFIFLFTISSVLASPAPGVLAQGLETETPESEPVAEETPVPGDDVETPQAEEQADEPPTPEVEGQIVGGVDADPGEWPWQVFLEAYPNDVDFFTDQFCGGTLIDPYWVLTAAHCISYSNGGVVSVDLFRVVAGVHDLYNPGSYQARNVVKVVRHPKFDRYTLNNDVALLKLASPITLGGSGAGKTATIPLADPSMGNWLGSTAWVTGWGTNYYQQYYYYRDNILNEVSVPVISNSVCSNKYGGWITGNMLCAGDLVDGGEDSCQGDSGGPLAIDSTGSGDWVLAGVVSWGYGCANKNYPGVYARVSNYKSWIEGQVAGPVVSSIVRSNPSPSKESAVKFKVTFSKKVTGVDASDFSLQTTGVPGAAISGVSGSGNVYTVSVNTGTGNGTIRLDVVDNDSIKDANSTPLGEVGAGNGNFNTGPAYGIAKETTTLIFNSLADYDGWVLETSKTSNTGGAINSIATTFRLGDDAKNKQYRTILHFDTAGLPDNASIFKATLKIKRQKTVGSDPFTILGTIMVDMHDQPFYGTTQDLEPADFEWAAFKANAAKFKNSQVNNWYTSVIGASGFDYINLTGSTQLRLRFKTGDNNNSTADYATFYSGNAGATSQPQLIVEYYILP